MGRKINSKALCLSLYQNWGSCWNATEKVPLFLKDEYDIHLFLKNGDRMAFSLRFSLSALVSVCT
jgi:hypothetical protein